MQETPNDLDLFSNNS